MPNLDFAIYFLCITSSNLFFLYEKKSDRQSDRHCDNMKACYVLPYIAPEVLCGKPYTKAADIYSFGIIMWEMTSGVLAFHNIPHDLNLSLDICKGIRPEIIEGTMPEYVELS